MHEWIKWNSFYISQVVTLFSAIAFTHNSGILKFIKIRNEVGHRTGGRLNTTTEDRAQTAYSAVTELVRVLCKWTSYHIKFNIILKVGWRDPLALSMAVLSNKAAYHWHEHYSYLNISLKWKPNIYCLLALSKQYMQRNRIKPTLLFSLPLNRFSLWLHLIQNQNLLWVRGNMLLISCKAEEGVLTAMTASVSTSCW